MSWTSRFPDHEIALFVQYIQSSTDVYVFNVTSLIICGTYLLHIHGKNILLIYCFLICKFYSQKPKEALNLLVTEEY
jgi:hypothetical protein